MDMLDTILRFFQTGGAFMYPIAVVLVIGVAIAIERWLVLTAAKGANKKAFDQLLPALNKGEYAKIVEGSTRSSIPMYRIVGAGLARFSTSNRRDDVEYAMEEGIMEALPRLEKRTPYLATLANISTLLGLLGTIIGLIAAFSAVANADPAEKATLLSNSISVAMNTTAFGLISAIPLLLFHSLLQTKTSEIVDSLEMAGVKVLNALGNKQVVRTRQADNK
ncbi:MotA/TolQ/ExbB proton channel family protein [Dasania sp. GY-MA-18]|uniref:MotA/TolQ/ExbB proton channel family protein n=1 Tax=Dasania phycosphaerae TaxID=2950436 RepID=A0A9J6RK58_9GAMM|nr:MULTISPECIES: MotA/TolQ/ExbB proton channel family protein [Dasania]MCR8922366.1 MotA/TolQ/ExbB proton channel family protein [Dasania sp. GY-MA-18]MCZ0864794.1 MotA/TolQ/ExbB proton channel family protein [Dasania phycosphaerae]MCZ0868522.1 MotA/TolQ/ExbB proton channel family protein [Dasania phycosphaerae]